MYMFKIMLCLLCVNYLYSVRPDDSIVNIQHPDRNTKISYRLSIFTRGISIKYSIDIISCEASKLTTDKEGWSEILLHVSKYGLNMKP